MALRYRPCLEYFNEGLWGRGSAVECFPKDLLVRVWGRGSPMEQLPKILHGGAPEMWFVLECLHSICKNLVPSPAP